MRWKWCVCEPAKGVAYTGVSPRPRPKYHPGTHNEREEHFPLGGSAVWRLAPIQLSHAPASTRHSAGDGVQCGRCAPKACSATPAHGDIASSHPAAQGGGDGEGKGHAAHHSFRDRDNGKHICKTIPQIQMCRCRPGTKKNQDKKIWKIKIKIKLKILIKMYYSVY